MVRYFYLAISLCLLTSCQPQNTTSESDDAPQEVQKEIVFIDTIPTPPGFKILAEAEGDLNKDQQNEKIIIYDTPRETEMGTEREIRVFQKGPTNWLLWHQTSGGILPSEHGGIMGDPFSDARIERGCIVIEHFGGSRQKWTYLHRYRFQNEDWELIGATVGFGVPCDNWETFDYNLSTGGINYKSEKENCESEDGTSKILKQESYSVTQDDLPNMDGMYPGNNGVEIPNSDLVFYY
ncbi:MAG: hypothetical protein AAF705_14495 [Bacteroidota bacterium]